MAHWNVASGDRIVGEDTTKNEGTDSRGTAKSQDPAGAAQKVDPWPSEPGKIDNARCRDGTRSSPFTREIGCQKMAKSVESNQSADEVDDVDEAGADVDQDFPEGTWECLATEGVVGDCGKCEDEQQLTEVSDSQVLDQAEMK